MMRVSRCTFSALLLAASQALAQAPLPGAQRVEFDVSPPAGAPLKVFAHAFTPLRPSSGARVPGVVILHGSEGLSDAREGFWGRELAALGMVALVVDSFTPRGVKSTVDDQTRVTTGAMLADAYGALEFLTNQAFIDPARVAIMGSSKGGGAALLASDRRAPSVAHPFRAHVTLYPFCSTQYRTPQPAAPLLMLLGEADDYTGTKACADYAGRIRKAGGTVELKNYKGAKHGFDGDARNQGGYELANAQNFRDCVMLLEDDGRTVLAKTGAVLDTPQKALEALKRECMRSGATIGADEKTRQQALEDVKAFVKTHLSN